VVTVLGSTHVAATFAGDPTISFCLENWRTAPPVHPLFDGSPLGADVAAADIHFRHQGGSAGLHSRSEGRNAVWVDRRAGLKTAKAPGLGIPDKLLYTEVIE
jgi:hypothetical protein